MSELERSKTVFVLSSRKDTQATMARILKAQGFQNTVFVDDGIKAIHQILKGPCDFIICEMGIRFISGWLLIKEIKISDKIPNIPAMLIGHDEAPASEEELKQYGVVKYLRAPYLANDVSSMITSTMMLFSTSGTIEAKYTAAKSALINQESDVAIDRFTELHGLTHRNSRSSIGLSEAYLQNKDVANAEKAILDAGEGETLTPSTTLTKAKVLLNRGEHESACDITRTLLSDQVPTVAFYYLRSVSLFLEHKQLDFVEEIASDAVAKNFAIPEINMALAKVAYFREDLEKTLAFLQDSEDRYGLTHEILNMRGVCLKKTGHFEEAIEAYEKALELSPMDGKIYFNLASCAIAMKDYAQAALRVHPLAEMRQGASCVREHRGLTLRTPI